jgi:uncharacterized protein
MVKTNQKKIWIDLDNSPHVPFFRPIIKDLEKKGFSFVITVRECAQTAELADLYQLRYKKIGRHYGKNKLMKKAGTLFRSAQLIPFIIFHRPGLAISHGARCLFIVSRLLRIPTLGIADYEHTKGFIKMSWLLTPDIIPKTAYLMTGMRCENILSYPGIKEDVYVPFFTPDPSILNEINVPKGNIIVTIRPPAIEAHYHNPESEKLYEGVIKYLTEKKNVSMVILSRYHKQVEELKSQYKEMLKSRTIIVPEKAFDGLNLIWFSDFVVSGGGTMNREAAALGVPVYSIFRGTVGAVDRYLSENGRLVILEKIDDIKRKITVRKRDWSNGLPKTDNRALRVIVNHIERIWETSVVGKTFQK